MTKAVQNFIFFTSGQEAYKSDLNHGCDPGGLLHPFTAVEYQKKTNLLYTRGITPKRVTSGGTHLRGLAPGQHSSKKRTQRWRVVGDAVSDLTNPGIESQTSRTDSDELNN